MGAAVRLQGRFGLSVHWWPRLPDAVWYFGHWSIGSCVSVRTFVRADRHL